MPAGDDWDVGSPQGVSFRIQALAVNGFRESKIYSGVNASTTSRLFERSCDKEIDEFLLRRWSGALSVYY